MASNAESAVLKERGSSAELDDHSNTDADLDDPATPPDSNVIILPSSQITLPSTEDPGSPIDPNDSFRAEDVEDRANRMVIPSSMTPPPSSQQPPAHNGNGPVVGCTNSQRSVLFSPPTTTVNLARREPTIASDYVPPTPQQVLESSADELRAMMQNSIAENGRLKTETAHYKLQFKLLSLQAGEDAKRAAVEHDMTRREVEALRLAENLRHVRRELSAASDSTYAKYFQLKLEHDEALDEIELLHKKLKAAKKVIQQKEDEIDSLRENREQLLTRIRENREHFNMLRSPGGLYHGVLTPKQSISTPQQNRVTPKHTPKSTHRDMKADREQEPFAALLHALNQENNSAPSTPTTARPPPRIPSKHTRNVQSLSSLPTTPTSRVLLPSVDLVPQTEPPRRYANKARVAAPRSQGHVRGRRSRESTISEPDNEELARQAVSSYLSRASSALGASQRQGGQEEEEAEVDASQASQAASEMLRRDPRESFEVASSANSRDGTPAPAEKTAKLQATLFSTMHRSGAEKRKFDGGATDTDGSRRALLASPPKKLRVGGLLGEGPNLGLGIQYSR